jgi:hypothetical protein
VRLTRPSDAIGFRPPRPGAKLGNGFGSHRHTPTPGAAATKNLPANAAPRRTAELLSLGKLWPVWGVLVACVWVAFSPVLKNGFVDWDDKQWILENHSCRGLGWPQI